MGRNKNGERIRNIIFKIRNEIPDVVLRTSLIVGFPGETDEDIELLDEFVREAKFDRLGVFKYSLEDGTPAAKLKGHLSDNVKEERYEKIMETQQKVSSNRNQKMVGKELECMIEDITEDGEYYIARSYMDVPNEDGVEFIKNNKEHNIGDFVKAKVVSSMEYDLILEE